MVSNTKKMFSKVLVANRGEIAVRIIKTLRRLNIPSVVVYTETERDAHYIKLADEAYSLGSGDLTDTYLNIPKLIQLAILSNSAAIHPGYGFLSENQKFAEACAESGIQFIGPKPLTISTMGNKLRAVALAKKAGLPVIPHLHGSEDRIINEVSDDFFPCLIKATSGGGGKAMHIAHTKAELAELLTKSAREAEKYFANNEVYVEKYFSSPRHIEVQILGDRQGNVAHLFERECTIQRRYQKVIEEAPSASVDLVMREKLVHDALLLAKETNYEGVGTVEFLVDSKGDHYFLEMNTRIQVEHAVTEMVTGVDLVEEQLRIASGMSISVQTMEAKINGHAIEARIYAEDPTHEFRPSTGRINLVSFPNQKNIRIDSDLENGSEIYPFFDPMIAKVTSWGSSREDSIGILTSTLKNVIVQGIRTNIGFLINLLENNLFRKNEISTQFITENLSELIREIDSNPETEFTILSAGLYLSLFQLKTSETQAIFDFLPSNWRIHHSHNVRLGTKSFRVYIQEQSRFFFRLACNGH
jgi:acetyl/propionyl-CoA carboxylase alpha subunit